MDDDARTVGTDELRLRSHFEERIAALEKIAVLLPVIAAEALLILSLFLPFVTVTSYSEDDELVCLSQLGLAFFGGASSAGLSSGDIDAVGAIFGTAFLGLFIVMLCSIVGLAYVARGRISTRAACVLTTFAALLVVGAVGAWLVIALGSTSESPWLPAADSVTLVGGAVVAGAVTFLPSFRSIWTARR